MGGTLDSLMLKFLRDIKFKLIPVGRCGRCKFIMSMDSGISYGCMKHKGRVKLIDSCVLFEIARNWREE